MPELRISCLLLLVNALIGTQTGALAGLQAFRAVAIINCLQAVLSLPLDIAAAYWFGVKGVVMAMVFEGLVGGIFNAIALRQQCKKNGFA